MYKTVLVKELVEEGEELIKRLESHRFQIAAALWYYFEDLGRWRLVIVFSTLVDREGPLRAYMHIQEALERMQAKELLLSDISVMRLNGHEFRELRPLVHPSVQVGNRTRRPWPRSLNPSRQEDAHFYRWAV
jgi:hypothetical protein